MYFDTFAEFLQMGKHGFYVWLAYGATGLVLLWSWMSARSMLAGVEKQLTEQAEITARGAKQTPARQTSESGASDES
ncbi:MAG: heme exporter protein CcmD [OM182 bacterium]|jgi:heme exporter protein D|nr:MAG: heme exporter protein CcmD [OM182 bacterium]